MSELQLVLIEWLDSRQPTQGWQFLEDMEMPKTCNCLSVGWLLSEDVDKIVIAAHRNDQDRNDQVMGVMVIPSRSVLKKILLEVN